MQLRAQQRRLFGQVLTFGVIWLVFGLVYIVLEKGILGNSAVYPSTGNVYNFTNGIIYTSLGAFVVGLLQGWIEISWLRKKFTNRPFWVKILFKSGFYLVFLIAFLVGLTFVINAVRLDLPIWDPLVAESVMQFFSRFAFWSIIIYIAVTLDVALFFSEMRDYLGVDIFYNYSFGKYYQPQPEIRIFMFLDMKSSTTIAERLGHRRYFDLIKAYFADMTDAILESEGEIYQYVGDEVVLCWDREKGLSDNNCIRCFAQIREAIDANSDYYQSNFGVVPDFKAGVHLGEVTAGEIGTLKKELIFTGDVLNTAARIQAECNNYGARLLVSSSLLEVLELDPDFEAAHLGKLLLRGKSAEVDLYRVELSG